jgi:hypothetical protein
MNRLVAACLLLAALVGCTATAPPTSPCYPVAACANAIISEATSLHQLELALAALQQAPTVVMQPTPVIVSPNPVSMPPVTVTPVVPTPVPPVVGSGGPVVTPSARQRRHSHRFDDNPPVSADALNAAQLSQLMFVAAQ